MPKLESNVDNLLYDQISKQIRKMYEKTLSHNELFERMSFILFGNDSHELMAVKMQADGSCMFHSIAHQLFEHKVFSTASTEHKQASTKIRQDVVNYITMHYSSFNYQLQGRVNDTINEDQIKDMDAECLFILNECLPSSHFFGGSETLKAVCHMYRVNILVFNEDDICYIAHGFDETYDRTIILAYRLRRPSIR